jgi:hypothetical protein
MDKDEVSDEKNHEALLKGPITPRNEQEVLQIIAKNCQGLLSQFPTTIEEDQKKLSSDVLNYHQRCALSFIICEKEILQSHITPKKKNKKKKTKKNKESKGEDQVQQ